MTMTDRRAKLCLWSLLATAPCLQLAGADPLTGPSTEARITSLVADLGSTSYAKRTHATRRLTAIGNAATAKLRAAALGDDTETALRAKSILTTLDDLLFAGVEIELSFSKPKIAWDEPVDLRVTMTNRSRFPAKVPFQLATPSDPDRSADARQVGDMLDVAEFLHVVRGDGRTIELTVDDIADDDDVVEAVSTRLSGGPVTTLKPQEQMTVTARAFNRGWARYRLLDAGPYTVTLDYVPQWSDDVLARERVGRVTSTKARINVTSAAPLTVSRGGSEASIALRIDGPFIAAVVTNRTDHAMLVNRNFGHAAPFATALWVWEKGAEQREISVAPKRAESWDDFDPAALTRLPAGESLELARIGVAELRQALTRAGASFEGVGWTVHFSYANLCDRRWQARLGSALLGNAEAPAVFQTILPRRILSTRSASDRLSKLPGE